MKAYKIRDKKTGQFTEGGRYAAGSFSEHGKIWWTEKSLRAFFVYFVRDQESYREYEKESAKRYKTRPPKFGSIIPKEWEVVEFEVAEKAVRQTADFLKQK